jgi:DNA-directed RNA polymerase specialized sigma24 family protein
MGKWLRSLQTRSFVALPPLRAARPYLRSMIAHGAFIYRFALRVSQNASIAEEVTQDTFLTLLKNPAQFDPSRGKLTTWSVQLHGGWSGSTSNVVAV